jgi:hypothetical protein
MRERKIARQIETDNERERERETEINARKKDSVRVREK